jgi:DNA polymerase-3 subunit delta'
LAGWAVPQVIDALQKLCADALALAAGAAPRYFPVASLPPLAGLHRLPTLLAWADELARVARHDEHPWNEALLLDALLARARAALSTQLPAERAAGGAAGARGAGGFDTLPR